MREALCEAETHNCLYLKSKQLLHFGFGTADGAKCDVQSHFKVTAYFKSKKLLPFGFALQRCCLLLKALRLQGRIVAMLVPPVFLVLTPLGRILVQVTTYRRLRIGRDGHLDQSEAYDISQIV